MSLKTLSEIFDIKQITTAQAKNRKPKLPMSSKDRPADYDKLRITMEKEKEKRKTAVLKEKTTKKIKKNVADRIKRLMKI